MSDAAAHATLTLARSRSGFFDDGSFRTAEGTDVREGHRHHHGRIR